MTRVQLDASRWRRPDDLYEDLLPALGAPDRHGRDLDAPWDGIGGGLNHVGPPLTIVIANSKGSPLDRSSYLLRVAGVFADAQARHGLDHAFEPR